MIVKEITVEQLFNTGNYNNKKLSMTISLEIGDDVEHAYAEAHERINDNFEAMQRKEKNEETTDLPF